MCISFTTAKSNFNNMWTEYFLATVRQDLERDLVHSTQKGKKIRIVIRTQETSKARKKKIPENLSKPQNPFITTNPLNIIKGYTHIYKSGFGT